MAENSIAIYVDSYSKELIQSKVLQIFPTLSCAIKEPGLSFINQNFRRLIRICLLAGCFQLFALILFQALQMANITMAHSQISIKIIFGCAFMSIVIAKFGQHVVDNEKNSQSTNDIYKILIISFVNFIVVFINTLCGFRMGVDDEEEAGSENYTQSNCKTFHTASLYIGMLWNFFMVGYIAKLSLQKN